MGIPHRLCEGSSSCSTFRFALMLQCVLWHDSATFASGPVVPLALLSSAYGQLCSALGQLRRAFTRSTATLLPSEPQQWKACRLHA